MTFLGVELIQLIAMTFGVVYTANVIYLIASRKGPGPLLPRITRWWYVWKVFGYNFHEFNQELHRRYGPIVEVMPGYYSIDDPNMHKTIYGHGSRWHKSEAYDAWHVGPGLSNMFSERNPSEHAAMRRKVTAMYSMSSLVSYEPYVDSCITLYYKHLVTAVERGSEIDLSYWMRCYAFDVISMITFGYRLGFLDAGEDIANLIGKLESIRRLHTFLSIFPWLMPVVHPVRRMVTGSKQAYQQKFASETIELQRHVHDDGVGDGPVCMVKKWINRQRRASKERDNITDLDIRLNAGANMGAGSETTAITLSAVAYLIYQHPQVLRRLRAEIDNVVLPVTPAFRSVQALPYLQAVIYEGMRVYPASGLPLWRQVPPGGVELGGRYFPAGTNIGANSWVTNFSETLYGKDAHLFRPERWLDCDGNLAKSAREEHYLTFGLGSRTCIGKNIALLEINKLIPVLVRDFDVQFVRRDGSLDTGTQLRGRNMFFVKPEYLHARLTARTASDA